MFLCHEGILSAYRILGVEQRAKSVKSENETPLDRHAQSRRQQITLVNGQMKLYDMSSRRIAQIVKNSVLCRKRLREVSEAGRLVPDWANLHENENEAH